MLKNIILIFIFFCTLSFFLLTNIYLFYELFSPILEYENIVSFSYIPLIPIVISSGVGFFGALFIPFFKTVKEILKKQPKIPKKLSWKPMIILAGIGFILNYANYYLVIKPNDMVICPLKKGYKSNLMRDYVKDLSLCEK